MQNGRTVELEIITSSYQQCIGHCRWKSAATTSGQTNQYSMKGNKLIFEFVWACYLCRWSMVKSEMHGMCVRSQMVLIVSVPPFLLLLPDIFFKYSLTPNTRDLLWPFQAVTLFHQSLFIEKKKMFCNTGDKILEILGKSVMRLKWIFVIFFSLEEVTYKVLADFLDSVLLFITISRCQQIWMQPWIRWWIIM